MTEDDSLLEVSITSDMHMESTASPVSSTSAIDSTRDMQLTASVPVFSGSADICTPVPDVPPSTPTSSGFPTGTTAHEERPLVNDSENEYDDNRFHSIKILIAILIIIVVGGGFGIGVWLLVAEGGGGSTPDTPFQLVNRSTWGAVKPKTETHYPDPPPKLAVIIHTDTLPCSNQDMCSSELRNIQKNQMKIFNDIAYNFLIGGDGRTYEGRGWDVQGSFAKHFNNVSFGIAFIGKFEAVAPPEEQLLQAKALLSVAVARKKLPSDYVLVGHRELSETESPGTALYNVIKTWPHWKNCYKQSCLKKMTSV